jgi:antirestriction protein ArdC
MHTGAQHWTMSDAARGILVLTKTDEEPGGLGHVCPGSNSLSPPEHIRKTYEIITDRIIATLEAGIVPWHKPWEEGMPRNLVSGKAYRGINVFMTASAGFASPYWLSFKQCKDLKGSIVAGSKGTPVVFWKWLDVDDETSEHADTKQIPMLRYYTVFNLEQTTGINPAKIPALPERTFEPIAACDALVDGMPKRPLIRHGEPKAYYRPASDLVNMPAKEVFDGPAEYYSTLFHELTHSTGHESRTNRHKEEGADCLFGSESYSKEELVAEMGAAMLCGVCSIENATIDNSAAYIASWLRVLKGDKQIVIYAAAQAQRASDYIQGITYQD